VEKESGTPATKMRWGQASESICRKSRVAKSGMPLPVTRMLPVAWGKPSAASRWNTASFSTTTTNLVERLHRFRECSLCLIVLSLFHLLMSSRPNPSADGSDDVGMQEALCRQLPKLCPPPPPNPPPSSRRINPHLARV